MKITSGLIIRAKESRVRDPISEHRRDAFIERIRIIVDSIHFIHEKAHPNSKIRKELIRHMPVALVATIQGNIKQILASLLDYDPTLLKKIKKIEKFHFDIESLMAMKSEKVTIGEIVAYTVNLNNLESILSIFNTLTENRLDKVMNKVDISYYNENRPLYEHHSNKINKAINNIFENRHVLCHEMASKFSISRKQIIHWAQMTYLFMAGIEEAIEEIFYLSEEQSTDGE